MFAKVNILNEHFYFVLEPIKDVPDNVHFEGGQMMFSNPAYAKGGDEEDIVDLNGQLSSC